MMTEQRQSRLRTIIQRSRARLMVDNPEFALVLMYLKYVATKQVFRISTNGRVVYFDPDWLQKLTGRETDYILSHQVMHLVREDIKRPAFFSGDRYHHACDIIINSFMRNLGLNTEQYPHIGKLPYKTYYPEQEGSALTTIEAFRAVPFDPSGLKPGQRRAFRIDSDEWWGHFEFPEDGTLILYPGYKDLSNEVVRDKEERGPDIKIKYVFSFGSPASLSAPVEEAPEKVSRTGVNGTETDTPPPDIPRAPQDIYMPASGSPEASPFPHSKTVAYDTEQKTGKKENDLEELDSAIDRLIHMIENMESASSKHAQTVDRILKGIAEAKLEWRKLLTAFLQEEVHDYSFLPPDRRFDDSGFFLPDFNERDMSVENVLFMVDSSGSVDDEMISMVYGEVCAAIEQFNGKLTGKLGFFNTEVTPPVPFCTTRELLRIRPGASGGTDFGCIFRYIKEHPELDPACIVIFTDGKGDYPPESESEGIPVLWILHGNADPPRWGSTARLV